MYCNRFIHASVQLSFGLRGRNHFAPSHQVFIPSSALYLAPSLLLLFCNLSNFIFRVFYYLPKVILASIVTFAVASLVDLEEVQKLYRFNKLDALLLLVTFFATFILGVQPGRLPSSFYLFFLLFINYFVKGFLRLCVYRLLLCCSKPQGPAPTSWAEHQVHHLLFSPFPFLSFFLSFSSLFPFFFFKY